MNPSPKPLARYLHTPITSEQIERNWAVIESALPTGPSRLAMHERLFRFFARPLPMLATAAAVGIILVFGWKAPWAPVRGAIDGAVLETDNDEEETLELADGSRILLESSTRLRLVRVSGRDIRLELERGAIDAQVTHVEGRQFAVAASSIEVGVVGTRFHVGLNPDDREVRVAVTEGRVQLTSKTPSSAPRFLSAGETWSARLPEESSSAPIVAAPAPVRINPAPSSLSPAVVSRPKSVLSRHFRELYRDGRYVDAFKEVGEERFVRFMSTAGPEDLFTLAQVSRLSGHPKEAATAFDALRGTYPKDPRAGLAALELGRLRLNELDDPRGAKDAFEDAVRLEPESFFREDAEARRIQALDAMHERDACVAARDLYLKTYPDGVHAVSIAARCR